MPIFFSIKAKPLFDIEASGSLGASFPAGRHAGGLLGRSQWSFASVAADVPAAFILTATGSLGIFTRFHIKSFRIPRQIYRRYYNAKTEKCQDVTSKKTVWRIYFSKPLRNPSDSAEQMSPPTTLFL